LGTKIQPALLLPDTKGVGNSDFEYRGAVLVTMTATEMAKWPSKECCTKNQNTDVRRSPHIRSADIELSVTNPYEQDFLISYLSS
jgi:hypothetical protein